MSPLDMGGHIDARAGSGHRAFQALAPASPAYAKMPIAEGFNWSECAERIDAGEWYLVAFRSIRRWEADEIRLHEIDDRAYDEARRSPGFVHYFAGSMNAGRECLSFCIWDSRERAQAGAARPAHQEAIRVADDMYVAYTLEYHLLRKRLGETEFELEPLGLRRVL